MTQQPADPPLIAAIICPRCHAELDVRDTTCSRCGAVTSERQTTMTGGHEDDRILDRPWLLIILLLHIGFLGIPLYWKTRYSLSTRLLICLASIAYTVFAVAVIYWGLRQIWTALNGGL